MLGLDSNAMTNFILAMDELPNAPADHEWISLVRIFLWMPSEACFRLTPTVEAEYRTITDRAKLDTHASWALSHLSVVRPPPEQQAVESRAAELAAYHKREKDKNDCTIAAECELAGMPALLTCDKRLLECLRMETRVWLVRPSEFWDSMRVPKGHPPNRAFSSDNPLLQCSWWHW